MSSFALENAPEDQAKGKGPLSPEETRKLLEELRRLRRAGEERDSARDEIRRFKGELHRNKFPLHLLAPDDKTAAAWGVPTPRVFYRRRVREDPPRPAGGQPGHPGRTRPRPEPNSPPLRLALAKGIDCGTRLGAPFEVRTRPVTDLPPPAPLVFEVEIPRYRCPGCHHRVEPPDPFPPHPQFGFVPFSRAIPGGIGTPLASRRNCGRSGRWGAPFLRAPGVAGQNDLAESPVRPGCATERAGAGAGRGTGRRSSSG